MGPASVLDDEHNCSCRTKATLPFYLVKGVHPTLQAATSRSQHPWAAPLIKRSSSVKSLRNVDAPVHETGSSTSTYVARHDRLAQRVMWAADGSPLSLFMVVAVPLARLTVFVPRTETLSCLPKILATSSPSLMVRTSVPGSKR